MNSANNNLELTEIEKLWIDLVMCNKRIAEDALIASSIMQRIGKIIFNVGNDD